MNKAGKVHVKSSSFIGNQVTNLVSDDWRYRDGGAIYFICSPLRNPDYENCQVLLESNLFERNYAENKGGALRYVNANFTTVYVGQEVEFYDRSEGYTERKNTGRRRVLSTRGLQDTNLQDSNTYIDNKAAYAPDIASFVKSYSYEFI